MRYKFVLFLLLFSIPYIHAQTGTSSEKYRVVIMTDMTHDDGNSLIRYLYYTPYFDTEAIIVTPQLPDFNHDDSGPWNKITNILTAYEKEYPHLRKHHVDFADPERLKKVTRKGRGALPIIWLTNEKKFADEIAGRYVESTWGDISFHDWIGEGLNPHGESKDSEGSEFLQEVFGKNDDRPLYVQMWGGPITFVQALYRFRQRNGEVKFRRLLTRLHVFGILLQDITFDFLIELDKVRALSCGNLGTTASTYEGERATPAWLLYDGGHFWRYITVMKQTEVNGHGPMSEHYDHGGEGDTPAFLYLISAKLGLNDPLDPTHGSWGTMFRPMHPEFPKGYFETCKVDRNEIERWIPQAKNSFLNRLQYSVKGPKEVNHEPTAVVNGNDRNEIIRVSTAKGKPVKIDASRSFDLDGDTITYNWFVYKAASDYTGTFSLDNPGSPVQTIVLPDDIGSKTIHLILEATDDGSPQLVSYRRVILSAR